MRRRVCLAACILAACIVSHAGSAQAIDCERLAHTNMPYQLDMKDGSGKVTSYQIYRREKLVKDQYNTEGAGVLKMVFQALFPISSVRPDGKIIKFEWSTPTDEYFFDHGDLSTGLSTFVDGKKVKETQYKFHWIDNQKISVASCTFETRRYVVDFNAQRTESWFSPDLHAGLKITSTRVRDGVPTQTTLEAVGIALDFKPLQ